MFSQRLRRTSSFPANCGHAEPVEQQVCAGYSRRILGSSFAQTQAPFQMPKGRNVLTKKEPGPPLKPKNRSWLEKLPQLAGKMAASRREKDSAVGWKKSRRSPGEESRSWLEKKAAVGWKTPAVGWKKARSGLEHFPQLIGK